MGTRCQDAVIIERYAMNDAPDIDEMLKGTHRSVRQMREMLKLVIESREKDLEMLRQVESEIEELKKQEEANKSEHE